MAYRKHFFVADVEDLAFGRVGFVGCEQQRVRKVFRVTVVMECQPVVGDDDARPAVENAAHDEPFAGSELIRPVHVRIAKVHRGRMMLQHRLLGAHDPVALFVFVGLGDHRRVLGDRHR